MSEPPPPALRLAPPPPAAKPVLGTGKVSTPRPAAPQSTPPVRGRPMLAAVGTVVAIISLIVVGLVVYRQREPATVSLSTWPSRVEVSVDGRLLGASTSPFVIGELTAGRPHEIVVSSAGHEPWKKVVTLDPGEVLTLPEVRLPALETGFVLTTEPAAARVFVDEKLLPGKTPLRVADMTPGEHRLRVELEGYSSWESSLAATKGTVLTLPTIQLQANPAVAAEPPPAAPPADKEPSTARSVTRRGFSPTTGERGESSLAASASRTKSAGARPQPEPAAPLDVPAPEPAEAPAQDATELENQAQSAAAPSAPVTDLLAEPPPDPTELPRPEQSAAPASPDKAIGTLRVNSRPWAEVFIDGKPYGPTPRLNVELPVGRHALRLVNAEFNVEKTVDFVIFPGETQSVIVNLLDK